MKIVYVKDRELLVSKISKNNCHLLYLLQDNVGVGGWGGEGGDLKNVSRQKKTHDKK